MEPRLDFAEPPFIVIWETTQACEVACVHCRAYAQASRSAVEFTKGSPLRPNACDLPASALRLNEIKAPRDTSAAKPFGKVFSFGESRITALAIHGKSGQVYP